MIPMGPFSILALGLVAGSILLGGCCGSTPTGSAVPPSGKDVNTTDLLSRLSAVHMALIAESEPRDLVSPLAQERRRLADQMELLRIGLTKSEEVARRGGRSPAFDQAVSSKTLEVIGRLQKTNAAQLSIADFNKLDQVRSELLGIAVEALQQVSPESLSQVVPQPSPSE
jgi:hypothetical protein